jgi:hypothetical protein
VLMEKLWAIGARNFMFFGVRVLKY